jgi:hypothetical protein
MRQIQVFRAGRHRAENGQTYEFSEADVQAIASAYDPQLHAAPIVLGHPKTDDPAFGWVKGFACEGGALVPEFEKVNPAFAEGVESGAYRYTSLALYGPDEPGNPKPGSWYPRHVGYLGARPPAIKGLTAAFAQDDQAQPIVFAEFADPEIGQVAGIVRRSLRSLRDWMISKFGVEEADKAVPQWNEEWAGDIQVTVRAEVEAEGKPAFAEPAPAGDGGADSADPLAERLAALEAREAAIAAREQQAAAQTAAFAEAALRTARDADAAYVDQLVKDGRLPPVHRDGVLASLAHARGDSGGVAFAEGVDAHAALRGLLDGLGASIRFAEFAAPDGLALSDDPAARAAEITRIREEAAGRGETISFSEAAGRLASR